MRLVLDTNILVASLIKDSSTRSLLLHPLFEFFLPEYSLEEIRKHIPTIVEKSGLSRAEINVLLNLLVENISIVTAEKIQPFLKEAHRIIGHIDENDVPFIALALALAIPNDGVWTNDKHFQQQKVVKVWQTEEILKLVKQR